MMQTYNISYIYIMQYTLPVKLTGPDATPTEIACGPKCQQWQSECIYFSGNVSQYMFGILLTTAKYASAAMSIYLDYGQPIEI